ncbi:MAG: LysR family transcriptional regulator [Gammaproteobacteria bacterium]|nr:LysR family transcriptional regulator [Gammaproteobacteria bacterium]
MLTSRMIEAFRAVVLNGGMSGAAEYLHISQPAVSRLIRDLEAEIGFALFDRRRGRVYPNEDALALYEEVDRAYIGINKIAQAAEHIRKRELGMIKIACMPAVALSVMPRAITRFHHSHPEFKIELQAVRSPTVMQFLNSGQCDIGFVEASFSAPSLVPGPFFHLETVCVLPPGHRLAPESVVTPQQLSGETFISLGQDSKTRFKVDAVFTSAGVERQMMIESPLTNSISSLVLEGCGVSIIEPMTAEIFTQRGIIVRPFRPEVTFSFRGFSSPRIARSSVGQEFYEVFYDSLPENTVCEPPKV